METIFEWPYQGDTVLFVCSADNWLPHTMNKINDIWYYKAKLDPGKYEYKFIVDDVWCYDITKGTTGNVYGTKNNTLTITNVNIDDLFYRFPNLI